MSPAAEPHAAAAVRLLVVDGEGGAPSAHAASALPELLERGDLVVVNDAATLPATLPARDARGAFVELRLVGALDPGGGAITFRAALLGAGDHRTRTEDRPAPPRVAIGDLLRIGDELEARVLAVAAFSERLVDVALTTTSSAEPAAVWPALDR